MQGLITSGGEVFKSSDLCKAQKQVKTIQKGNVTPNGGWAAQL